MFTKLPITLFFLFEMTHNPYVSKDVSRTYSYGTEKLKSSNDDKNIHKYKELAFNGHGGCGLHGSSNEKININFEKRA